MRKWLVGIVFSVVISGFMVLSPGEKTLASTIPVQPMFVDSYKEAKENFNAKKGLLYSKEEIDAPTIYEFTVPERGWFIIEDGFNFLTRNNYCGIYSNEFLSNKIECYNSEYISETSTYCMPFYLEPGTYFIKDESYTNKLYAYFLPDSKVVSHTLKKAKMGKPIRIRFRSFLQTE